MKRIGIITFHRADNYGAVLQTYATQTILNDLDYQAEVIDYRSPELEEKYKLFKIKDETSIIRKCKTIGHDIFRILRRNRFMMFRKKYLKMNRIYVPQNIQESNKEYDVFLTGSDQVWNDACSLKDPVYCLTFAEDNKKKISFSASFGYDFVEKDREDFYKNALGRFDEISVRERSGISIVQHLIGKTPDIIPDPTFMLTKERWNEIAKIPKEEEYILVYLLNARNDLLEFAQRLAKKTGLSIINITDENHKTIEAKYVHNVGPCEFLGYYNNAKYVVTNSFHGLMFSLIYRKSVYVDIPGGKQTTYERLTYILNKIGIEDRYIQDIPTNFIPSEIDYTKYERKISELKQDTLNFINKCL